VNVFRRRDGAIRGLVVVAAFQLVSGILIPVVAFGERPGPLSFASLTVVASLIPLEEATARGVPWRTALRSVAGAIAITAIGAWVVVFARAIVTR
jgi:hypothetical protein